MRKGPREIHVLRAGAGVKRRILTAALVVLLGVGAASCAGEDQMGSPAHRLSVWVRGTGFGEDIGTLVADNARIPKERAERDQGGPRRLRHHGGRRRHGQRRAPHPRPDQVTDWLSTAYGLEGTAATDCYNAGSTNKKLLAKAEASAKKADLLYERALIRIQSIDGVLPSTTTTTDNAPIEHLRMTGEHEPERASDAPDAADDTRRARTTSGTASAAACCGPCPRASTSSAAASRTRSIS